MTTPASAAEPTPSDLTHTSEATPTTLEFLATFPGFVDTLDDVLDESPAAFLEFASSTVGTYPTIGATLSDQVDLKTRRPLRALVAANSYFRRRSTIDIVGIDLPRWLTHLDDAHVTRVGRRRRGRFTDWLIELVLPGGHQLSAHLLVEPGMGALGDALVVDGGARELEGLDTDSGAQPNGYTAVDLDEAGPRLVDALGRYRASIGDPDPASRWPGNEALVTWLIATLLYQTESADRAA